MEKLNQEISVEHFMAIVQDEITNRRSGSQKNNLMDTVASHTLDWEQISNNLNIADQNIHIGTREFSMLRFGWGARWLARFVSRLVQYIARVITFQQIEFNQAIVVLVRNISNGIRQQSVQITDQTRQIADQTRQIADQTRQIADQTKQIEKYDNLSIRQGNEIAGLKNQMAYIAATLRIQEQLFYKLVDEVKNIFPNEAKGHNRTQKLINESEHIWDTLYVKFEDRFRGSREEIKKRLIVYIPVIQKSGLGTEMSPILDIACGRGEWLELLKESGLIGRGLDLNLAAVEQCRNHHLEVIEADAFRYLRKLPDSVYGIITAFHFVEHLSFYDLIKFFDEVYRVLKPGGMIIFETPNPENIAVGANYFYMDPTHRNPLPSPFLEFIAGERGFVKTEIMKLNPFPNNAKLEEISLTETRFNEHFYGPRDYALIGFKNEIQ